MEEEHIAGITLWGYIYGKTWASCNAREQGCSGIIRDGIDRPAMTWLKEYFNFQEDSTTAINGRVHLQANTLQAYDVFDLNGVRLGRLRAYTIDEAVSILKNTSDIKVQGVYMLRSVRNGTVKQVRIAR